mgnify:CR=1 FL=1
MSPIKDKLPKKWKRYLYDPRKGATLKRKTRLFYVHAFMYLVALGVMIIIFELNNFEFLA